MWMTGSRSSHRQTADSRRLRRRRGRCGAHWFRGVTLRLSAAIANAADECGTQGRV
jgi:hypothetical protein